jgi:hypothetical protein
MNDLVKAVKAVKAAVKADFSSKNPEKSTSVQAVKAVFRISRRVRMSARMRVQAGARVHARACGHAPSQPAQRSRSAHFRLHRRLHACFHACTRTRAIHSFPPFEKKRVV